MQEKRINIDFNARYFQLGEVNEQTKEIWFVCHGQGQLAQYFLKRFEILSSPQRCIIAPEALSHYYLNGYAGRVGASWMTREDRLNAIRNYLSFMNKIYETKVTGNTKIVALGFSQGVATICRWVNQPHITFDKLIIWGGVIPPDLEISSMKTQLKNKKIIIAYGNKDPFLLNVHHREQQSRIEELNINPTFEVFEGEHVIDEDSLLKTSKI